MKRVILSALLIAAPLSAQHSQYPASPRTPLAEDRGYDKPQARTDAINAPNRAELDATNRAVAEATAARDAANRGITAQARAVYDYDAGQYLAALRARDAAAAANESLYAAKQRAYAEAMTVWRQNVADCNRGSITACRAPTPDPAAFF